MAIEACHIPTPDEIRARRARLGFVAPAAPRPVRMARPIAAPEKKPAAPHEIVAKFRLVYDGAVVDRPEPPKLRITVAKIVHEVAEKYRITREDILSRRRTFSDARAECMYRARFESCLSYPVIGRHLGGLDHSSVMAGVRRHQARIDAGTVGP